MLLKQQTCLRESAIVGKSTIKNKKTRQLNHSSGWTPNPNTHPPFLWQHAQPDNQRLPWKHGGWAPKDQDTRTSLWCLFAPALDCRIICWPAAFTSNNPGLSVWQDYLAERNASPASITCGPLFWEVKIKPANLRTARYGPDSTDYDPLGAITCEILSPVETTTSVRSFLLH